LANVFHLLSNFFLKLRQSGKVGPLLPDTNAFDSDAGNPEKS
jgi:hypothetical protein